MLWAEIQNEILSQYFMKQKGTNSDHGRYQDKNSLKLYFYLARLASTT